MKNEIWIKQENELVRILTHPSEGLDNMESDFKVSSFYLVLVLSKIRVRAYYFQL